jgi:hypothetical protein
VSREDLNRQNSSNAVLFGSLQKVNRNCSVARRGILLHLRGGQGIPMSITNSDLLPEQILEQIRQSPITSNLAEPPGALLTRLSRDVENTVQSLNAKTQGLVELTDRLTQQTRQLTRLTKAIIWLIGVIVVLTIGVLLFDAAEFLKNVPQLYESAPAPADIQNDNQSNAEDGMGPYASLFTE